MSGQSLHTNVGTINHRPEIDGLRAVAVVAVILYHAGFAINGTDPFLGGYIGVDIFFVISGYLITSIILREISTGSFSFSNFYERRARRILPALFVVMATTIPFAWIYMLPKAMKEYAGSALAALLFSSNIWFWQEDGYTAEPSELKPLLHTWSLSVEEQFYLFFPVLLILLWKFAKQHMTNVFLAIFFVSLLAAHLVSVDSPDGNFFLLPTRAWELLAGAILAKFELEKGRVNLSRFDGLMPSIGMLMVFASFILFDHQTSHPSLITLLPVLGTMCLIWFCREGDKVTALLSSKPLVAIGLVSYSLYLWHFPIFAFAKIKDIEPSQMEKISYIGLALLLSVVSYYCIEKPARKRNFVSLRSITILLIGGFLALFIIYSHFYVTDGASYRYKQLEELVEINYWNDTNEARYNNYQGCALGKRSNKVTLFDECRLNEGHSDQKILVIGDSHARMLIPGLTEIFGKEQIAARTASGCEPYLNYEFRKTHDHCNYAIPEAFREIERIDPDLIIVAGFYRRTSDAEYLRRQFSQELAPYINKIILVGPLPNWGEEGLPKILSALFEENKRIPEYLAPIPKTFEIEAAIRAVANDLDITYLSPVDQFCVDGECLTKVGEAPDAISAWDYSHLTHKSSIYLIRKSLDTIQKFL